MKRLLSIAVSALAACICIPGLRAAQETNATTNAPTNAPINSRSFAAFKLIYERNIFNQNRRPGVVDSPKKESPKPSKTDRFFLVGTLIHERGSFAFFDGSDSQYQTVLKKDQIIGGFKLAEIATDSVKLNSASNSVELFMGMQMKREDEGPWQTVAASASSPVSSGASASATAEESTGDAAADAILKRLMQQREKEINK